MTVPFWSNSEVIAREREEILQAVERVLDSGQLILDREVRSFEAAFASRCGRQYGIGVNSGTDAIQLALGALEMGVGKRIATVSNSAVATASAILAAGATPVFIDVDRSTGLMDLDQLDSECKSGIDCVLPVHLYGQCVALDRLAEIGSRHGVPIIEDCAQAHDAQHAGRPAGSVGQLAAYSFYPTKNLGAIGDAGLIVTDDATLATRARQLRFYGLDGDGDAIEPGVNSRLDEIQAAVLSARLGFLDSSTDRRRTLAATYDRSLADSSLELPGRVPGGQPAWHLYVVRHPRRDQLREMLAARGIQTAIHYPLPVHLMHAFRKFPTAGGRLPVTEERAREIFSLPLHPGISDADQRRVCDALLEVLRELGEA